MAEASSALHSRYPAISDLKKRARRRVPHFVWEYLDSATGTEATLLRNRAALDRILFEPSILHGEIEPRVGTTLLGRDYALPIGMSPVGMSGLIWPGAEVSLARAATAQRLPYCISTVAAARPEEVGPHLDGRGWFQIYPPRDPDIRRGMLSRVKAAGFDTLVLTVDVPAPSRRERQTRGGLVTPPKLTPRLLAQVLRCPAWALGTYRRGMPRMRLIDDYAGDLAKRGPLPSTAHVGYLLRTSPDWDYLKALRDMWDGPLVVKGVLRPEDCARLEAEGADAIWVSNHAGRQFDGAPATIEVLPAIRAATQKPVIFDSGIEGGLDVLRALALGADFVMLGRAWHYALAALGEAGPAHLVDMIKKDIISNMNQLGAAQYSVLAEKIWRSDGNLR